MTLSDVAQIKSNTKQIQTHLQKQHPYGMTPLTQHQTISELKQEAHGRELHVYKKRKHDMGIFNHHKFIMIIKPNNVRTFCRETHPDV